MTRQKYLKGGLSKEATAKLLKLLKKRSALTWKDLEDQFGFGTGSKNRFKGGAEPGETISNYANGSRTLQKARAYLILQVGLKRSWLSFSEYSQFSWDLFEKEFTNDHERLERNIFEKLEPLGRQIIGVMHMHPDLGRIDFWEAIDKVIGPMLKRLLVEDYEGKKHPRAESFCAVLGDDLIKDYSKNYVPPEIRFSDFLGH